MNIDAHQHFWKFDSLRDTWISNEMKVLQQDFLPLDLLPLLAENNMEGCVAVQADQSEHETEFLLGLANEHPEIKGVVGWVDLQAENCDHRLSYFSSFKKLKGFRHIVQAEPLGFLLSGKFQKGISYLKNFNFTYDILIHQHQLSEAFKFAQKFPQQKFVIDHLAKPSIKENSFTEWKKLMAAFSVLQNV